MTLLQAVQNAFHEPEFFKKEKASIILTSQDGEMLTIPTELIFSKKWAIQRNITEESNPKLYRTIKTIAKSLGVKERKKSVQ